MQNNDILVIGDTQVKLGVDISHLYALSKYIWEHKPKSVVLIGDHFDFPSLSKYKSNMELLEHTLLGDLEAGTIGLDAINEYWQSKNITGKRKHYKPDLYVCLGNHENRVERLYEESPYLRGIADYRSIFRNYGWTVVDFLQPLYLEGVLFRHYLTNPESGRPVGGSIDNKLNKTPTSFVHGHQQKFQYGRRQNLQGKPHFGACVGSFYIHDEDYRGWDNTEQRGMLHLKGFTNRYGYQDYDPDFVSIERLLEKYGDY